MASNLSATRKRGRGRYRRIVTACVSLLVLGLVAVCAVRAIAGLTDTRLPWATFFNNPYVTYYTMDGKKVTDFETSSDPTNGGSAVQPSDIDIASGSPNPGSPGTAPSVWYGYYNGGTPWDPNDPATMNDDRLFFRLRVGSNPKNQGGSGDNFVAYHWNILIDSDGDGYKEYWLDLDGSEQPAPRLKLMYNNDNTQLMLDPTGSEINRWIALSIDTDNPPYSHTRALAVGDGTTQWFIDFQIPMSALKDKFGNQVVYPHTPIRLAYSTSASNTDPLQKDWMGYTPFGDIITYGTPSIRFTDKTLLPDTQYYRIGDQIYVVTTARSANQNMNAVETITVSVTNPSTGDVEWLTLVETGVNTGIFSNRGSASDPVSSPSTGNFGWIPSVSPNNTVAETWTATYDSANSRWVISGTVSGFQGYATAGTAFTSNNGQVSFTIYKTKSKPANGATITFQTYASDPLYTSTAPGTNDDGTLQVNAGDWITTRYVDNINNTGNYDDWAQIYGPNVPIIRFTRADGTDATTYQLTTGTPASDLIYVTVDHAAANTNPNTVQTIQVTITGTSGDLQTITLTETGPNTGVFRNTTGLASYASNTPTLNNNRFEEYVGGIAAATYTYGANQQVVDYANIIVPNAGTVAFVNGTGILDVEFYGNNDYMWIKVTDTNYDTNTNQRGVMTVTVTNPTTGDSELVTLYETGNGTHTYMNTLNDLQTTAGSAVVTSSYYNFQANGVVAGDTFLILSGPDMGTYTVQSVSGNSVTLTTTLTTTRTAANPVIFAVGDGTEDSMLLQAKLSDGSVAANDDYLESYNTNILEVRYVDTNPAGTLLDTAVFGASPTAATIAGLSAASEGGRVVVQWETTSEYGTAGFHLLRLHEASGKFQRVNSHLLPGLLTAPQGGTYRLVDPSAQAGKTYTYQLLEVETRGTERMHGPYRVTVQEALAGGVASADDLGPAGFSRRARPGPLPPSAAARAAEKLLEAANKEAKKAAKAAAAAEALPNVPDSQRALKIGLKEAGLYYVSAAEIGPALGMQPSAVAQAIRKGKLALTCRSRLVPYLPGPGNAGILFYGLPVQSIYTAENVYWLRDDRGLLMARGAGCGAAAGPTPGTFAHTEHAEVNQFALTALFTDPEADFWLWDFVFATPGYTAFAKKSFTILAPDAAASGTATLVVRLKGATSTDANPDHHARIAINGTLIGEGTWDGTQGLTLTLPFGQQLLQPGANTVTVEALADTGAAYSTFYVDSFDLTYQRFYLAVNGSLLCAAGDRDVVTVGRFAKPAISVFDVTDPWQPVLLEGATVEEENGSYLVSVPAAPGGVYFALTPGAIKTPLWMEADVPSRLAWKGNKADYVVIAPAALMDGAKALAAYREGKKFATMVVDLEDIYDEFSYGIVDPHAVQAFLAQAKGGWKTPPRYVALAGNGTYDYKNYQGFGDNLLPPLMMATDYGLFASDGLFAPGGMAIGRLPAANAAEMSAMVNKIGAYEAASGNWTRQVVLAADKPDPDAGFFPQDSDDLSGLVPAPYAVDKVYASQLPLAIARAKLIADLNSGAYLFNYIGHGSATQFGTNTLLSTSDVGALANGNRLPVVTAFTCLAGRFEVPGMQCLGKAFVVKSAGGGIAFWGPSALSENNPAKALAVEFFRQVFGRQEAVLGDAVLKASAAGPQTALIYQLLGDPALRLRRP